MRIEVIMPQMGESIVEGTVVAWRKKPGETVRRDEDIFTISTDKVDAEIPSPADGVLVEIKAQVGEVIPVGGVVAYLETDPAAAKAAPKAASAAEPARPAPAKPATPVAAGKAVKPPAPLPSARESAPAKPAAPAPARAAAAAPPPASDAAPSREELRRSRSTPLVRRMAREAGVSDLATIPGTGVSGRVTRHDLVAFLEKGAEAAPVAPAPAAAAPSAPAGRKVTQLGDFAVPAGFEPALVKTPRIHVYANDRVEPMSRMRASIAENMLQARRNSAHCHTVWEADVTPILQARKRQQAEFEARGVNLTLTAFFVAAVVEGLKAYPVLNSVIDGNTIVYRGSINLGIASAIEEGLIVPVLKEADSLNLLGVARGVNDLAARSKNRQLKPSDVADGTFTITNSGIFGSLFGVPILVTPQVGILNIGGIKKRVVADEQDNILVRSMCHLCLTFDHRIIDGATADGFMKKVVETLASFK
jgi:2-oxoglutarate dehydrogenase E2 component (dihydrolipoamide succinyltransferase)